MSPQQFRQERGLQLVCSVRIRHMMFHYSTVLDTLYTVTLNTLNRFDSDITFWPVTALRLANISYMGYTQRGVPLESICSKSMVDMPVYSRSKLSVWAFTSSSVRYRPTICREHHEICHVMLYTTYEWIDTYVRYVDIC